MYCLYVRTFKYWLELEPFDRLLSERGAGEKGGMDGWPPPLPRQCPAQPVATSSLASERAEQSPQGLRG